MNSVTLAASGPRERKNLAISALGPVFGVLATSPLYTLRACFGGAYDLAPTPDNVLGVLSVIFWAITLVVSLKYAIFMMRADNQGEGGLLALMSLIRLRQAAGKGFRPWILALGLIGTALFYGDSVVVPALSILSATEGLPLLAPDLRSFVLPIAVGILVAVFSIQRHGMARLNVPVGPAMVLWFASLTVVGSLSIAETPEVLEAINPLAAARFFARHGIPGLVILGAVILAVGGGEALYADMGHFGRRSVRRAWFMAVFPALLANHLGQGALLIRDPTAVTHPFFLLVPEHGLAIMLVLATMATVIGAQVVISGAFSLTAQAIRQGFCPRLSIEYTSEGEKGQVYVPWVNWMLFLGCTALALGFRSSSNLVSAYGIAVSGTMVIESILAFVVVYRLWQWNPWLGGLVSCSFLMVDLTFLVANIPKIMERGWLSILAAIGVFVVFTTWKRGRDLLLEGVRNGAMPIDEFVATMAQDPPRRVRGVAVFMTGTPAGVPQALLHNVKHNKILHHTVILVTVLTENVPRVPPEHRREIRCLGDGLYRFVLHYGYMETPNVPRVLRATTPGLDLDLSDTTFFLSRETLVATGQPKLAPWRIKLFMGMQRNTLSAVNFFRIPPDRVVEIGTQILI